jgi:short-subunit dehydrogenase
VEETCFTWLLTCCEWSIKDNVNVTLICPGFIQTNVAVNALTGDGSKQNSNDQATLNGMPVAIFAKKLVKAVESNTFESYRRKRSAGHLFKRFFPKLLHRLC